MTSRSLRAALILAAGGCLTAPGVFAADKDQAQWHTIETYCFKCHNTEDWAGSVAFDTLSPDKVAPEAKTFESAIRKLRGGLMPPPGADRPQNAEVASLAKWMETKIDSAATQAPAGRVQLHRLNRREYANAIRDLLGLNIAVEKYLPVDNLKNGFDNNAEALQVSPAFIDQYLNAARSIAHDAIGDRRPIPIMETYGNVADMIISLPPRGIDGTGTQERHSQGMPFGTRGGVTVEHNFMADGEYELSIGDLALAREVPNLEFENTVVALLDGKEFYRTTVGGERDHKWIDQILDDAVAQINARLKGIRFHATAGQHTVSVTFVQRTMAESDERSPVAALEGGQARMPAIHAIQLRGPLSVTGMSDSESRKRIFICYPRETAEETACAKNIIVNMAERAFRRPLNEQDTSELLGFYEKSRKGSDFETGVRDALSAIMVSPHFIYRAETGSNGETLALNDFELASRLSFFIWSSVPDTELLTLANKGQLHEPAVLKKQITRMLADARSKSLVKDFTAQWLNLAKLDEIRPNAGQFRYASGRLDPRPMFKEELNLFVDSVLRSDQSVTKLLNADYTFLNERLAMQYGIENIKGSKFRKVQLTDNTRNGLLGKGAILMLTANPNRTSPVLRGAWILERLLGTPPTPPPPGVEALKENGFGKAATTVRERLEKHRANPTCFGCHGVMDPLGFALENFNTVGQFRTFDPDTQTAIDSSGVLPDGKAIKGPADLVQALVARSDMFVETLTQNLMTYALGREIDYKDMPTVRKIARAAAKDGNRFDSIVYNVVTSNAFGMREGVISGMDKTAAKQQASL
jgi:mono/diheme cytochrome c family protein